MTYPVLYSFRRCPYAMRARMAVYASAQQVELREVVLRDKPTQMIEISPKATVPVLQLPTGEVIDESLDVMYWALCQNDPEGWIEDSLDDMKELIRINDSEFKKHLDRYKYATRYDDADPITERNKAEEFLKTLNNRLEKHRYLFGDKAKIADYAITPFIRQFAFTDKNWFDATDYKALQNWLNWFLSCEIFESVMPKFKQWHLGDEPTLFGRID